MKPGDILRTSIEYVLLWKKPSGWVTADHGRHDYIRIAKPGPIMVLYVGPKHDTRGESKDVLLLVDGHVGWNNAGNYALSVIQKRRTRRRDF